MKRRISLFALVALAALGTFAGMTFATGESVGTNTVVATACADASVPDTTVPGHSVGVDGSEVHSIPAVTVPGASDHQCQTETNVQTYTIPTVTETVTSTAPPPPPPPSLGTSLPARMPESSGSQTLIVSPSGSGSSSCTVAAPCSLTRAFALATSGTIIQARAGTYYTQVITNKTYSASNPVTLTSYPGDARPVFFGPATNPTSATNGVYFGDVTGVRLRGLKFTGQYAVTCLKLDSVVHFEVDDAIIQECGKLNSNASWNGAQGVLVGSSKVDFSTRTDDLQILNSRIFDWRDNQLNRGHNHGLYLATLKNSVFANNVIYNDVHGGGYGIQLGASANNNIIANNTIDGVLGGGGSSNGSAMVVWTSNTEGSPPTSGNLIVNNLFTNNTSWAVEGCGQTPTPQNIVRDNLTFGNGLGAFRPSGCNTNGSVTFVVQTPNYTGDPLYVNRSAKDFHLQSGSPALGKAEPAYTPPTDRDGAARDSSPNLGAY